MSTVIDTPEGIEMFRILSLRGRLKLEVAGLRFRVSTLPAVNKLLGTNFRRKQPALDALEEYIERIKDAKKHRDYGGDRGETPQHCDGRGGHMGYGVETIYWPTHMGWAPTSYCAGCWHTRSISIEAQPLYERYLDAEEVDQAYRLAH